MQEIIADRKNKYIFLSMREFLDTGPPDPIFHFYGATAKLPGLPEYAPKDLTLIDIQYLDIVPDSLSKHFGSIAEGGLLCNVTTAIPMMTGVGKTSANISALVLSYPVSPEGAFFMMGVRTRVGLRKLRRILSHGPDALVLKIDERDDITMTEMKEVTCCKLIMLWNTATGHVIMLFREALARGIVEVYTFELDTVSSWHAILFGVRAENRFYLAPQTRIGIERVVHEAYASETALVQSPATDLTALNGRTFS
jgi:hypothetical protein